MNNSKIYQIAFEYGLTPKKISAAEWHTACPRCGGKDRFIIWASSDRYWCRQCEVKGDAIQFCRDFFGLTFQEACQKIGEKPFSNKNVLEQDPIFKPPQCSSPSEIWINKASNFIENAHNKLLRNLAKLDLLYARGFSLKSIRDLRLGWNGSDIFDEHEQWGIDSLEKRKVWIPSGILIPSYLRGFPNKLKIRRSSWYKDDRYPKYVEVAGSQKSPSFFGESKRGLILLESELDAMLVFQEASDLCTSVAIGTVKRTLDRESYNRFLESQRILFSLDFDEAGKKAFKFWKRIFPWIQAWPSPIKKSIGDGFMHGVSIRKWVEQGLKK